MNFFMVKLIAAMDPTTIVGVVVLGLLIVALFVLPSLTNKKRQKQITDLYRSVEVGDKIKTVGGIIGTVIDIKEINALESEILLETGVDENKTILLFDMQAVYQNLSKTPQQVQQLNQEKAGASEAFDQSEASTPEDENV